MVIVYDVESLRKYMVEAVEASQDRPVLIDRYLEDAIEVDVDCISDGETSVIGAIMEHVELAGVHSGDSACVIPAPTLSEDVKNKIRQNTFDFARELHVCGLMNVQYAVHNDEVYVLEVNPRASRTIPFVSKAIGVPLAKLASLVMAGSKLKDIGFTDEIIPPHYSVKEAVFPFIRFPGIDVILSPEMKSTGEVMGLARDQGTAFLKSQLAAGNNIPKSGNVFLSVRDADKEAVIPLARSLVEIGYNVFATIGTSTSLMEQGIKANAIFRISDGRPNVLDMIEEGKVGWIINTPSSGAAPKLDEVKMRARAVIRGIPITTTVDGLKASINGLESWCEEESMEVCTLQEYHVNAPKLNFSREIAE